MPVTAEYLGMPLRINDNDVENLEYFRHCAEHNYHLQQCSQCGLLRYPPGTACPWCQNLEFRWAPVEGKGTVYSYGEVHHAIQPAFRERSPYLILLVELDTQRGQPSDDEGLRVIGNLATPDGELASAEAVRAVGIGSRMRMVFKDLTDGLAIPLWTVDEGAEQPQAPWRYPQE